ncbi:MAG: tripartite tricarboxylate transporter TctB family protein [Pseudomonadota bacterium]
MKLPTHINKDYYGGALMALVGVASVVAGIQYNIGTLQRMGPGFFPCAVGALLTATGVAIAASARMDKEPAKPVAGHTSHELPDLRGALCIIAGVVAFLVLGNYCGLLPATFAIVFISAMGDRSNTVMQSLVLSSAMMIVATVVFWWALQLQIPLLKWGN